MLKWFFICLFLFFLIRFVLKIVLPILRVTRMTHAKMNEMKHAMQNMAQQQESHFKAEQTVSQKKVDGEYIEFEEVK